MKEFDLFSIFRIYFFPSGILVMTQVKQGMIQFWKCSRIRNMWWLILRVVLFAFFKLWFRHLLVVWRLRLKEKLLEVLRVLIQCAFSSLSQGKSSPVSGPFLWPIWKLMITVLWFSLGEICSLQLWESSEIKMSFFLFFTFEKFENSRKEKAEN